MKRDLHMNEFLHGERLYHLGVQLNPNWPVDRKQGWTAAKDTHDKVKSRLILRKRVKGIVNKGD